MEEYRVIGDKHMGDPKWSYEEMVYELDRLITSSKKADITTPIERIEKRIKKYEHDYEFYFKCGLACGNVMNDIIFNEGTDSFNAALGGMSMFRDLIGLEDE